MRSSTIRGVQRPAVLGLALLLSSCGGGALDEPVMSAEEVCATFSNSFGQYFFCGSPQGNLQVVNFPDGARGYCVGARENLGLVGYSVTTSAGGYFEAGSQAYASGLVQFGNVNANGYIRCTRV